MEGIVILLCRHYENYNGQYWNLLLACICY